MAMRTDSMHASHSANSRRQQKPTDAGGYVYTCTFCGATIAPIPDKAANRWRRGHCSCQDLKWQQQRMAERDQELMKQRERWLTAIGLTRRLRECKFEWFKVHKSAPSDAKVKAAVEEFVECYVRYCFDFAEDYIRKPFLTLVSETRGNGKTLLAAAAVMRSLDYAQEVASMRVDLILSKDERERHYAWIESLGKDVRQFTPDAIGGMVHRLSNWRWVNAVDLQDLAIHDKDAFKKLQTCFGLVIDDVGQEYVKRSDDSEVTHMSQLYYQIINERYNRMRPTIMTTNLIPDLFWKHIGPSQASRLSQEGYMLYVHGPDRRKGKDMTYVGFDE